MWRTIASRSRLSGCNFAKKVSSFQNSQCQVTQKPFNYWSSYYNSHVSILEKQQKQQPRKITPLNHIYFPPMSALISELEHDEYYNPSELELGINDGIFNDTHDDIEEDIDVEKLEKVVSLLRSSTIDESLESNLNKLDLILNDKFLIKVLETENPGNQILLRFFNWVLSKNAVGVVTTLVLNLLSRRVCNDPRLTGSDAYALFGVVKTLVVKDFGVVNPEILNSLMLAFLRLGMANVAYELFGKFEQLGCFPDGFSYELVFEADRKRNSNDPSDKLESVSSTYMLSESERVGEMISMYCNRYCFMEAYNYYLDAKESNVYPPQYALNYLITSLSKSDKTLNLARELLVDIPDNARKNASNAYFGVINGLCRKNDIKGAKNLLNEMIEKGPLPGNNVFGRIIHSLTRAGELEDAKEMIKLMKSRGLVPLILDPRLQE